MSLVRSNVGLANFHAPTIFTRTVTRPCESPNSVLVRKRIWLTQRFNDKHSWPLNFPCCLISRARIHMAVRCLCCRYCLGSELFRLTFFLFFELNEQDANKTPSLNENPKRRHEGQKYLIKPILRLSEAETTNTRLRLKVQVSAVNMSFLTPRFYLMNFSLNSLGSLNPELSPQIRFF